MQQLAEALERTMKEYAPDQGKPPSPLLAASVQWASYCLENMRGDLLTRGLAVSAAIANFDVGFHHPETLTD